MNKVLIVKLAALGDVIATSPIPRLLKEADANLEIHFLVMDHCKEAVSTNLSIDKILVMKSMPSQSKFLDVMNLINIIKLIRKEKFSSAFIFHRSLLLQFIIKLSGIKYIYGYTPLINFFLKNKFTFNININRTLQEVGLVNSSEFKIACPKKLEFNTIGLKLPSNISNLLPDMYIACNPGGGNFHSGARNRLWPIDSYIELISKLDVPVVLLGSGNFDLDLAEKIINLLPHHAILNFVNKSSLTHTALILKNSVLYFGNDSSLAFLSTAVGVPAVVMYGPTQSISANPLGNPLNNILTSRSFCSPCYNPLDGANGKMYTCENNICMQSISPSEVLSKINLLIGK